MTREQFLQLQLSASNSAGAECHAQRLNPDIPASAYFWASVFLKTKPRTEHGDFYPTKTQHFTERIHWETYDITQPSTGTYPQYATDCGARFEAGENGVTITQPGRESVYIPYSDISEIYGGRTGGRQDLRDSRFPPFLTDYYNRNTPV